MKRKSPNIGIVTFPISEAGVIPLSNLIRIFYSIIDEIYLITGDAGYIAYENDRKVHAYQVEHSVGVRHVFTRVINYAKTQVRISAKLLVLRARVDIWVFFMGAEGLILPILTAKLIRKKVVITSAGSGTKSAKAANDTLASSLGLLQTFTYHLSDRIILYSNGLIEEQGLQKYRFKISIAHKHFLDFNLFKMHTQLIERDNFVGYIGRLSEEKGVLNFIKAIPDILKKRNEVKFFIGGGGQLKGEIERYLNEYNLNEKVKMDGWIEHDDLPQYLNELKLIVLPSYTEGLPNIMLEAMACGTPVLATPVGAIPDFIKDGVTGFIMEDNSPACISSNILRALSHPSLEQISNNGRNLVEKEFTFEKAVERYRQIMSKL